MSPHVWIGDVLADLEVYCERNGLSNTKELVDQAKLVFWSEIKNPEAPQATHSLQSSICSNAKNLSIVNRRS